jgi:hypothetical protein
MSPNHLPVHELPPPTATNQFRYLQVPLPQPTINLLCTRKQIRELIRVRDFKGMRYRVWHPRNKASIATIFCRVYCFQLLWRALCLGCHCYSAQYGRWRSPNPSPRNLLIHPYILRQMCVREQYLYCIINDNPLPDPIKARNSRNLTAKCQEEKKQKTKKSSPRYPSLNSQYASIIIALPISFRSIQMYR